ncbi:diaminopimelate decarboxylase, partial [Dehalococcoidia bacterium]|nr:diaminopimelate decarboxylase [Dehalococcoidia bacterium]
MPFDNVNLFPITAGVNTSDHLVLGGCDVVELAREFGSPLLVYDEETLRAMCRQFVDGFTERYPNSRVAYASKAFLNPSIAKIVAEQGLGLDVVSGGELAVAMAAGVPIDHLYFHGNNKSPQELEFAVESGIGRVVVDNFYELRLLTDISRDRDVVQDVMVRLSPNVDPHTHVHTTTGILDSKFGFAIETGDAARAIGEALEAPNLDLVGVHFHLGSPIFELEPYSSAIDTILGFIAPFKEQGLDLREVSPGGGFAIGYVRDQPPPDIDHYAEAITDAMKSRCAELGFGEPRLTV